MRHLIFFISIFAFLSCNRNEEHAPFYRQAVEQLVDKNLKYIYLDEVKIPIRQMEPLLIDSLNWKLREVAREFDESRNTQVDSSKWEHGQFFKAVLLSPEQIKAKLDEIHKERSQAIKRMFEENTDGTSESIDAFMLTNGEVSILDYLENDAEERQVYRFSQPYFTKDNQYAVMEFWKIISYNNSIGYTCVFKKQDRQWKLMAKHNSSVS